VPRVGESSQRETYSSQPDIVLLQARWYALYSCANHEKRVAAELRARNVEHFLPLYTSVRQWKDRRVQLDMPLFPGYVFIRLPVQDRLRVLNIPGVVRLVGFNGKPSALPDEEMEIMRSGFGQKLRAEPHPFLTVGRRVRIARGPLAGLTGVLKRYKNGLWVVLSIEVVERSIIVSLEDTGVTPLI
jgi:transcription termination/antitermination protein NusG